MRWFRAGASRPPDVAMDRLERTERWWPIVRNQCGPAADSCIDRIFGCPSHKDGRSCCASCRTAVSPAAVHRRSLQQSGNRTWRAAVPCRRTNAACAGHRAAGIPAPNCHTHFPARAPRSARRERAAATRPPLQGPMTAILRANPARHSPLRKIAHGLPCPSEVFNLAVRAN